MNLRSANCFVFSVDRLVVKIIGIGVVRSTASRKLLTVLDTNGERGHLVDMTAKCGLFVSTSVQKVQLFWN